ncbi:hypothetical protein ACSQ67_023689 [Phaseolus vulgaris]
MAEELPITIPQSQGSSIKKRPSKKHKVWLEDYLHLLHSRQTLHLTINQLNQVIRIHGFKKIHHAPKVLFSITVSAFARWHWRTWWQIWQSSNGKSAA